MRNKRGSVKLNCFSPPVMLATLTTESLLTIYTLWRYKWSDITRLAAVTLVCLASFQLAEYKVCTGYGSNAEAWSRFGFIMITTLPALGVHIMHRIAGKPIGKIVYAAYGTMLAFWTFFLTYHAAFIGHQCTGNYVIFQMGNFAGDVYGVYYYGWLFVGMALGIKWANDLKVKGKKTRKQLESVRGLIIGYLVFLVPTALANSIKPESREAIPSIMCGFAVIFALVFVLYILPRQAEVKSDIDIMDKLKNI